MAKHPVIEKAEELARALKRTNTEDPLEFHSLIVTCNQIIESTSKLDYSQMSAMQDEGEGCSEEK